MDTCRKRVKTCLQGCERTPQGDPWRVKRIPGGVTQAKRAQTENIVPSTIRIYTQVKFLLVDLRPEGLKRIFEGLTCEKRIPAGVT